jgi:hypothetical protein
LMATATPLPAAAPYSAGFGEVDATGAAAIGQPPNPNAALERFVVPDPDGGPTPVFDGAAWQAAASADPNWAAESWGTESWGTESWGTESWGTAYWRLSAWATESWGTESWGTESWGTESPTDGASGDVPDPTPGWIGP